MDLDILNNLIEGRITPHIYAFSTNTVPNYLKVGDTYRPVSVRLNEWKKHFQDLEEKYQRKATINNEVFFRDYAVHSYLETELNKERLTRKNLKTGLYFSNEFFKDTTKLDIENAIKDIESEYKNNNSKYQYYNLETKQPKSSQYESVGIIDPRPNQTDTIKAFVKAVDSGRKNLLMYAVMRFGKSFTALSCAVAKNYRLVVVVSGKADVKDEWEKTVKSIENFKDYTFLDSKSLYEENIIENILNKAKQNRIVLFLTLADLQGVEIKIRHAQIFKQEIDLLIVDETHFGARAEKYGEVLKDKTKLKKEINKHDLEDFVDYKVADKEIKTLKANIKLHLSGTPYRILMDSEFTKEDIIAFYQFSDIVKDKKDWDEINLLKDEKKEWDNPYYGFPQMIRFAFNPNESSIQKMKSMKKDGVSYNFSDLFRAKSLERKDDDSHKTFINEEEVFELFQCIDGSKSDANILSFLKYDKINDGNMCRHMVIVLPFCTSCDALEKLLIDNRKSFKYLCDYEIINIAGKDNENKYKSSKIVKQTIRKYENENKKTITLTVNRMLTGSTVHEWDTMLYFKDTMSPQDYDQAIFRLQNQYIKKFVDNNGDIIKYNMKPQTILVDFDPNRMFYMQEKKALIYNINTEKAGNKKLKERIDAELHISPIIAVNAKENKLVQITATNILDVICKYSRDKSVADEAKEIPIDLDLLNIESIRKVIENENEFGDKNGGLSFKLTNDDTENTGDMVFPEGDEKLVEIKNETKLDEENDTKTDNEKEKDPEKQFKMYYSRILFFAFLTKSTIISLEDIIKVSDEPNNTRIIKNLGLNINILKLFQQNMNPYMLNNLDYKIKNIHDMAQDDSLAPMERCMLSLKRFGKLGSSEVITPQSICNDMINLIPNEDYLRIIEKQRKILDLAGKVGEFAISTYSKYIELGYSPEVIKDIIYTIPTSSVAYEFTRKIYENLGLNTNNIAEKFNSYDLLKVKNQKQNEIDYDMICSLLMQSKSFNKISLDDEKIEGSEKVKFDAIVGNPPYQEETAQQVSKTNGQATRTSIFQYFQIISDRISNGYASLIYPGARWIHRAGKGMAQFGLEQINDVHLKQVDFYPDSNDVFAENVDISDGLSIVTKDMHKTDSSFIYSYHKNGKSSTVKIENPGEKLIPLNPKDAIIVNKVESFVNKHKLNWVHERILPRNLFGIESNFVEANPSSVREYNGTEILEKSDLKILTNDKAGPAGRSKWFIIGKNLITKGLQFISQWKVVVSSAHPGGQEGRDSQIELIDNNSVFGRSRVALGTFDTYEEALNFYNFSKSNLIKFMYLMTDESLTSLGKKVPDVNDYTNENTLLDFTGDINAQLCKLVDLKPEEIEYVSQTVAGLR